LPDLHKNGDKIDSLLVLLDARRKPNPSIRKTLATLSSQTAAQEEPSEISWWTPLVGVSLASAALVAAFMSFLMIWPNGPHGAQRARQAVVENTPRLDPASKLDPGQQTNRAITSTKPARKGASHKSLVRRTEERVATTNNSPSRMTVDLPYSNRAISTGTDATVQIAMADSTLRALGFPIPPDQPGARRIWAEVSLGDDGLPRSVSLSFPLQLVKED